MSRFRLPDFAARVLPNGARLFAAEYHALPLVDIEVILGAGASVDPPGREGLADMVAGLLHKGAAARSAHELAEAVDFVGGSLGAAADQDGTRVTAEFLIQDLDLCLELLSDVLIRPGLAEEEVARARTETLAELQAARENPSLMASRRFVELLYAGHPYGHATAGRESSVAAITRQDVVSFYKSVCTPERAIVVAVGDFKAGEMLDRLERRLGPWEGRAAAKAVLPRPAPPAGRRILLVDKPDATQSQIRIGGLGMRRTDPDFVPIHVANTILGGGFTSRLVQEVRVRRGLTYGISSRLYPLVEQGPFLVSTFTKNATTGETLEVALGLMDAWRREGATAEELDKAKRYIRGKFAVGHQAPEAMADAMGEIAFYDLPAHYYNEYLDWIEAVTLDDVRRVAATRFPSGEPAILVLGRAAEVLGQLEKLGPVTVEAL